MWPLTQSVELQSKGAYLTESHCKPRSLSLWGYQGMAYYPQGFANELEMNESTKQIPKSWPFPGHFSSGSGSLLLCQKRGAHVGQRDVVPRSQSYICGSLLGADTDSDEGKCSPNRLSPSPNFQRQPGAPLRVTPRPSLRTAQFLGVCWERPHRVLPGGRWTHRNVFYPCDMCILAERTATWAKFLSCCWTLNPMLWIFVIYP